MAPSSMSAFRSSALGLPLLVSPGETNPLPPVPVSEDDDDDDDNLLPLAVLVFNILFGGVTFDVFTFSQLLNAARFGVLYIFLT